MPRDWKGDKDAWRAREERRLEGSLSAFDAATQQRVDRLNKFGEIVRGLVKDTRFAPAPQEMNYRAWSKWWRLEKAKLEALEDK